MVKISILPIFLVLTGSLCALSNQQFTSIAICSKGVTIPHSDRNKNNPCTGNTGSVCKYTCNNGFFPIGKHVCQYYKANGKVYIDNSFYGGRCERYCSKNPNTCPSGQIPIRMNSTDESGPCFRTFCFENEDAALKNVAKGNYEVWKMARNNKTGIYIDTVDVLTPSKQKWQQGSSGINGLGMIFECVADAMGWEKRSVVESHLILTLRSLNGMTPGMEIPRDPRGFFPHFFNSDTGVTSTTTSCLMCSGLQMAGALFAKEYFKHNDPDAANTKEISRLVDMLWDSTKFYDILCKDGIVSPNGTGIPMVQYMTNNSCGSAQTPASDGFYGFNEEMYTVWFAYEQACGKQAPGKCSNNPIETMWKKWWGRRFHPNHNYDNYKLLSVWSGYLVQLPFYTVHPCNSDSTYQTLFHNHWLADWAFYNETDYAGERGRYGLGAGTTPKWCTGGKGYYADRLTPSLSNCRMYSPYITAGYIPTAPEIILPQLLELFSDGESVMQVPNSEYFVLWRKAMLDPEWTQGYGFTMVDFSSELFGLSTIWLGTDFYQNYTNHFVHNTNSVE